MLPGGLGRDTPPQAFVSLRTKLSPAGELEIASAQQPCLAKTREQLRLDQRFVSEFSVEGELAVLDDL